MTETENVAVIQSNVESLRKEMEIRIGSDLKYGANSNRWHCGYRLIEG
jgi:hypothetical protein